MAEGSHSERLRGRGATSRDRSGSQTVATILTVLLHRGQKMKQRDFCLTVHLKERGNTIWWLERVEVTKQECAKQYPRETDITGSGLLGRE